MKVVIVQGFFTCTPHFETDLELIQRHLDGGDEVTFLSCHSELVGCDGNPYHEVSNCADCIARRMIGVSLLSGKVRSRSFFELTIKDKQELLEFSQKRFSSIEELRNLRVENYDIGFAVLSSLASNTRDPRPDLHVNAELTTNFMIAGLTVYRSVQNYLDRHETDRVYVFNGRFAPVRAVLRACQSRGVECFTHDRGQDIHHFALFRNTLPHDIRYADWSIRDTWARAGDNSNRKDIGTQFFLDLANRVPKAWRSFITEQKEGLLPSTWDREKKNIAIFSSSDDEFVSVDETWILPHYRSQADAIERILDSLAHRRHNLHIYLRLHPNLKTAKNEQVERLMNLRSDCLTVIKPDEPVSSYALLQHAHTVFTFGSTVGIEAVFWGKPSILAGPCFYQHLGATYNPTSHEELIELLTSDLSPKDRELALMYGYYLSTFGIAFAHFKARDLSKGEFKGRDIHPRGWLARLLDLFSHPRLWRVRQFLSQVMVSIVRTKVIGKFSFDFGSVVRHYAQALIYIRLKNQSRAETHLSEAVSRTGNFIPPLVALAELKLETGNPESAIRYARQALRIDPKLDKPRTILIRAYEQKGDIQNARRESEELSPSLAN